MLSGDASVRSTAGRLGSTEADLTKSSTAGGEGDFPATIMYCKFETEREREMILGEGGEAHTNRADEG